MAASRKLTKQIRNDIVEIVINKTFDDRRAALNTLRTEIYHQLIDSVLPDGFLDVLKMENVKDDWFPRVNHFAVRGIPNVRERGFTGNEKRVPKYLQNGYSMETTRNYYDLSDDMKASVDDYIQAESKIKQDEKQLQLNITEVVNSVTTFQKLKDLWPEVEQYYKLDDNVMYPITVFNPANLNGMIEQLKMVA